MYEGCHVHASVSCQSARSPFWPWSWVTPLVALPMRMTRWPGVRRSGMRVIFDAHRSTETGDNRFQTLIDSPLRSLVKSGQIEAFLTPVFVR
jgi:hypothetical protein